MSRRLKVDWDIVVAEKHDIVLKQFEKYLRDNGLRRSTIELYLFCAGRYIDFAKTNYPTIADFEKFRETLHEKQLKRHTINNYCFAIKRYHKMLGEEIDFPFLKPNNEIPYFFDESDVLNIFSVCRNIKHLTMLQTLFYGCLRASELCNLDDEDVDLRNRTLRIREGKGGQDGLVYITHDCASILKQYLIARPTLEIDGHKPLFYTDYGNRFNRREINRIVHEYKRRAGITKPGGAHVFARHTPATIMVANGCDIRYVKEILRHWDIKTTLRYAHINDRTKRERYEQYLTL